MSPAEISRTALDVEWQRLSVVANNLANAQTASRPGQAGFRPRHLVSEAAASFRAELRRGDAAEPVEAKAMSGVRVRSIELLPVEPRLVHEPANPMAGADGFVAYPGFDFASEMTLLLRTARIYEANLVALGAARAMSAKALELGRRA